MAYTDATAADLKAAFPTFEEVSDATVEYWLGRARRSVDQSWTEGDYAYAQMLLAAHYLSIAGQGTEAAATSDLPAGITSMKIGTLGLTFDSAITRDKATGSLSATRYGAEYLTLLRRNRGGPLVMPTGIAPYDNIRWPQGE